MRARGLVLSFVIVGLVIAGPASAAPPCKTRDDCQRECKDGGGAPEACTRYGELLARGRGGAAARSKAALVYEEVCDETPTDPAACLALANLVGTGWLFEVERDQIRQKALLERGLVLARSQCDGDVPHGCGVAAEIISAQVAAGIADPSALEEALTRVERGCTAGDFASCALIRRQVFSWLQRLPDDTGDKDRPPVLLVDRRAASVVAPVAAPPPAPPVPDRRPLTRAEKRRLAEAAAAAEKQRLADLAEQAEQRRLAAEAEREHAADVERAAAAERARRDRLTALADDKLFEACTKGELGAACDLASLRPLKGTRGAEVRAAADKSCAAGDEIGCLASVRLAVDVLETKDVEPYREQTERLIKLCDTIDHPRCVSAASTLLNGSERMKFAADPARARTFAEHRCQLGDGILCDLAARLYRDDNKFKLEPEPAKVRVLSSSACMLSSNGRCTKLCKDDPDAPICQLIDTYDVHTECLAGSPEHCEETARRFRTGIGVPADGAQAARHYRLGCAGARKSACAALDELCAADRSFDRGLCVQSLIHTDLFYEAEWQFRTTGNAQLMGKADPSAPAAPTVSVAAAPPSGAGVQLARGHLDADLVVSVVLDRARQAALRLVVEELTRARVGARAQYMRDLLAQGARLLADPSTLRREKFADLAMTVVRAFIAANLVDTLYPDSDAIFAAPVIGPPLAAAGDTLGQHAHGPMSPALHTYLVDLAYARLGDVRLGDFHLFARGPDEEPAAVPCPWSTSPGRDICQAMEPPAAALEALRINRVLEGVRLAKALRGAGTIDLRRLIDAVAHSRSIADLSSTPGLVLSQWRAELVDGTRARIQDLASQVGDVRALLRAETYGDTGADLQVLSAHLAGARAFLADPATRFLVGDDEAHLKAVFAIITGSVDKDVAPAELMATIRPQVLAELKAWGGPEVAVVLGRLSALSRAASAVKPAIDKLEVSIVAITSVTAQFTTRKVALLGKAATVALAAPGGKRPPAAINLSDIPLYAIGDLRDAYRDAVVALSALDTQLRQVMPGSASAQLQFARSSAIRLLGFLDMLERVARTSRLQETAGEVFDALGTLGSLRHDEFTAPLFDVVEPVLEAIKTHEPMSVELLFAVISRVRLDSLIESLHGGGRACANDTSVDCWTVKIIHALQESVERDGDTIRIDGGKFAERLAAHGDDFRRRHRWRGYFHLTVGVGAMASTPPGEPDRRSVPVIAEQIGFGWASPTVWKNRLTFKFGAAASGVLYRALLDSNESNAIMLHPAFLAVDVYDLVELYVSPGTVLVYPPTDSRGTELRWGPSAGLSVPLSAYLEKL